MRIFKVEMVTSEEARKRDFGFPFSLKVAAIIANTQEEANKKALEEFTDCEIFVR